MQEIKGDADAVFKRWVADIRNDKKKLYLYSERKKHLDLLMGYLLTHEIEMDDAIFLKNKVVDILVHEEGLKGKNKYKDWKKNTQDDFDDCVQLTYIKGINPSTSESVSYKQDPEIVAWAMEKFNGHVPPRALKDCHTIGHSLYFLFIEELRRKTC